MLMSGPRCHTHGKAGDQSLRRSRRSLLNSLRLSAQARTCRTSEGRCQAHGAQHVSLAGQGLRAGETRHRDHDRSDAYRDMGLAAGPRAAPGRLGLRGGNAGRRRPVGLSSIGWSDRRRPGRPPLRPSGALAAAYAGSSNQSEAKRCQPRKLSAAPRWNPIPSDRLRGTAGRACKCSAVGCQPAAPTCVRSGRQGSRTHM
mmetsp:Transcript_2877/g.9409  ORF Transcript_2877/g.9409 Transcript_2877/m.9409 type:complete len:200 (+) Transcript_2877:75-674(+)